MEANTISHLVDEYDDKTEKIFNEIEELEENKQKNDESTNEIKKLDENSQKNEDFFNKIENKQIEDLYKELLARNDTKEKYVLSYLLFLKKTDQEKFEHILKERQHYISEENYNKYFGGVIENRKCAREKFLNLIDLLANCSLNSIPGKGTFNLNLIFLGKMEPKTKLGTKYEITWENKELYLFNLYLFFLNNLIKAMNKCDNGDDNNKEEIKMENYFNNFFFNEYLPGLSNFLSCVYKNFKLRFGKLKLESVEDQLLFEDFVQFIGTYTFRNDEGEYTEYIDLWNDTFSPITKDEKKNIFSSIIKRDKINKRTIEYNDKLDQIEIKSKDNNNIVTINKLHLYSFENLCSYLIKTSSEFIYEWSKNKCLKPQYLNTDLFVSKKKNIWGDLLFSIMNSESFREAKNSLFKNIQIDFFIDRQMLNKIIDNIRFITYHSHYFGETHPNTLRIYENGIFNRQILNRSISLLIFHSSNIVINIHEMGGHINRKLQHFFNENTGFEESPELLEDEKDKYSQNSINRKGESGETMEILLFGRVLFSLTIKEALYILNVDNYIKDLKTFKADFGKCNNKDIKEILSNENLHLVLKNLDINKEEIMKNMTNENYPFTEGNKSKNKNEYKISGHMHSPAFYDNYNFLQEFNNYVKFNNIDDDNLINAFISFSNIYNNRK